MIEEHATDAHEIDTDDLVPQTTEPSVPDAMEQAQKDAAERRLEGGGYDG